MRIRNQRPTTSLLEPQVVQQPRQRLQSQTTDDNQPDSRMVTLHVLVAVGHPDPHSHDGKRDTQGEDLPGGVQPDGDAAWEHADEDRAHGEEEREGEAAENAVGGLDVVRAALGSEKVLARVPVLFQGVLGVVAGLG